MKNRTKHLIFTICAFAAVTVTSFITAYFSETDSRKNTFRVGNVDIEIQEEYEPTLIHPNEMVTKNPSVKNVGKNEAYVFLEVDVPKTELTLLKDDGTLLHPRYDANGDEITDYATASKSVQEIFRLIATPETGEELGTARYSSTLNNNSFTYHNDSAWIQLVSKTDLTNENYNTYVFAYSVILSENAETETLFDIIQLQSFIDGEVTYQTSGENAGKLIADIDVRAYAIQTELENFSKEPTDTDFFSVLYDMVKARDE